MILNTRRLFCRLLQTLQIDMVCDVGSMDGAEALRFRRMVPGADILAFEPNPRNFSLMQADDDLRRRSIRIFPVAVSDRRSEAPFHIVDAQYSKGRNRFKRGMGSLFRCPGGQESAETIRVPTVRLDEFLSTEPYSCAAIAVWIDVEGKAVEVIKGCSGILPDTCMFHVEVETKPIFGVSQKLFADADGALVDAGFIRLATDQPEHRVQFNALYLRADMAEKHTNEIMALARFERVLHVVTSGLIRYIPIRFRLLLGLPVPETRLE